VAVTEAEPAAERHEPDDPVRPAPAAPRPQGAYLPYFPGLDGVRGIAVIAVLVFHAGFGWAVGGYLGVSMFFTLSGFLITSLIFAERAATGTVDLKAFWVRRFRRLMPAALAALALATVFGIVVADALAKRNLAADVVSSLLYVANWRFVLSGQSYAQLFAAPSLVQHFWSLAIEEQFYLFFPLVAYGLLKVANFSRARFGVIIAVLTAASVTLPLALGFSVDRIYYGTDTRAAELLVGVLLAVVLNDHEVTHRIAHRRRLQRGLAAAGFVALVASVALWTTTPQEAAWLYRGGFFGYSLLSAFVILAALLPTGPVQAVLSVPPLRWLGQISYGVYLYHWPVFLWLDEARTGLSGWGLFAVRVAATLALSLLSYRFLEMPIRRGGRLWGRPPIQLAPIAAGAIAVAVVAISLTAPAPAIDFEAAQRELTAVIGNNPPPPPPPDPASLVPPKPRVAVFGDSTALLTGMGLSAELVASGKADVVSGITRMGCGITRYGDQRTPAGQGPLVPECNDWGTSWKEALAAGRPNVAVVQVGPWEVVDRRLADDREWRSLGDAVFDDYLRAEMLAAVDLLSADGAEVVWMTLPPMGALPGQDPFKVRGSGADPRRAQRYNELVAELPARRPGKVQVVDLASWLVDSGEDARLRPDGVHFGLETSREVARRWLADEIVSAYEQDWKATRAAAAPAGQPVSAEHPMRVMTVGDSAGLAFAFGFAGYKDATGLVVPLNTASIGCGIGRGGQRMNKTKVEDVPDECERWAEEMPAVLERDRPDAVVVTTAIWDLTDRRLPGDDVWRAPGDPVYDAYLRDEFAAYADVLHGQGAEVAWLAYPPVELGATDVPQPREPYPASDPERMRRQNDIAREVAATRPWMRVLALDEHARTFPGGEMDRDYRIDGVHFTADGAVRIVEDWLYDELVSLTSGDQPA
jgi:peptidoglycan/LPS O-acetylase OafA/YrhL/lysophospholipase L1-like esterase